MCITDLLPIPAGPPESRRSEAGPAGGSRLCDWQDDAKTCLWWTAPDEAIRLPRVVLKWIKAQPGLWSHYSASSGRGAWRARCAMLGVTTLPLSDPPQFARGFLQFTERSCFFFLCFLSLSLKEHILRCFMFLPIWQRRKGTSFGDPPKQKTLGGSPGWTADQVLRPRDWFASIYLIIQYKWSYGLDGLSDALARHPSPQWHLGFFSKQSHDLNGMPFVDILVDSEKGRGSSFFLSSRRS